MHWNFSSVISCGKSSMFLSSSKSLLVNAAIAGLGSLLNKFRPHAISSFCSTPSLFVSQAAKTDLAKHSESELVN